MTTKTDIASWFKRGIAEGATHLIVVCDTFDYDDFPVFVKPGEDVRTRVAAYSNSQNMTRVMEVYNLSKDMDTQLNEHRSFNY